MRGGAVLEVNHTWTPDGASSGGLTPVEVPFGVLQASLYVQSSTLASTQSFQLQTAQNSTGPWFSEGSTSLAATASVAAQAVLHLSASFIWARPYLNSASTGTYLIRLIGVS